MMYSQKVFSSNLLSELRLDSKQLKEQENNILNVSFRMITSELENKLWKLIKYKQNLMKIFRICTIPSKKLFKTIWTVPEIKRLFNWTTNSNNCISNNIEKYSSQNG